MYYGLEEGTSVGLVFILVRITLYKVYTVIITPLTPGPGAGLCHGHPRHHGQAVQEARHHRGGHQPVPCGQLSGKHQSRDCEVIW